MDYSNWIILIVNALVYILIFISYQRRKKTFDIGSVLLLTWIVGSSGAVYYYTFEGPYLSYNKITVLPLIFLLIINLITFSPFLKANYNRVKGIETYNLKPLLLLLSAVFSLLNIPIFLNLILRLSSISLYGVAFAEMYYADVDKASIIFAPFVKPLFSIIRHFQIFAIFLFFYNLSLRNRNILYVIGLGLTIVSFFLFALLSGSRGGIFSILISCSYFILIMRNALEKKVFSRLIRFAIVFIGLIGVGVAAISISRLSSMNNDKNKEHLMDQWISQYAGEGIVRYDNTIWHITDYANGYQNLPVIISLYDERVKDLNQTVALVEPKVKNPITVFYTYVGDLIIDFGIVGSFIVALIIHLVLILLLRLRREEISIYKIIILNYFFVYLSIGFTANIFRTYYTQISIVETILLLAILYVLQNINYIRVKPKLNV